ncbi:unnamed protein product [Linum trigynum]|uniref:Uncharacterized protein n=1 Tax=Linum trigynum TaxID=586398 RepID=A0AAV2CL96_9ROSI
MMETAGKFIHRRSATIRRRSWWKKGRRDFKGDGEKFHRKIRGQKTPIVVVGSILVSCGVRQSIEKDDSD